MLQCALDEFDDWMSMFRKIVRDLNWNWEGVLQ